MTLAATPIPSALDVSDLWEIMDAARARLDDARDTVRLAHQAQINALRAYEEARLRYSLACQRRQAALAGGAA